MAVLVQDSFTGTNGTLLENHSPEIGGAWVKVSGTSFYLHDYLPFHNSGLSGGGQALYYNNIADNADGYVQAQPQCCMTTVWLIARYIDINNYYYLSLDQDFGTQQLYKNVSGVPTLLYTTNYAPSGTDVYKLYVIGTSLKMYWNTTLIHTHSDSSLATGKYGIGGPLTFASPGYVYNFEAGVPAAPSTPTGLAATCVKPTAPTASFSTDITSGTTPLTVQFNNATTGAATLSYLWDFGDGSTSTTTSPSHVFSAAGTYTVTLTATNSLGSSTYTALILVYASSGLVLPPTASFTASIYTGVAPLTVQFTDTSTNSPATWAWTFGDGGTSSSQNPSHQFTSNGTYTVTLTVTKDGVWTSSTTKQIVVTSDVVAVPPIITSLGASATAGSTGLSITFTPTFAGGTPTSFAWNFGDTAISTIQSPTHIYTQSGIYMASLTATNQYGSTTASIQITIVNLTDQQGMPTGTSNTVNGKKIGYFIVDTGNNRILVYEKTGGFIMAYGGFGSGNGQFNLPTKLVVVGAVQGLEKVEV